MGLVNLFKSFTRGQENAQDQLNQNFTDVEKYIEDTDWIELTLTSDFKPYSATDGLRIRRIGKTVFVKGLITPTRTITANEQVKIAEVPTNFVPKYSWIQRMQGTGMATWLCESVIEGGIKFSRYGNTDYANANSGVFLPINFSYPID